MLRQISCDKFMSNGNPRAPIDFRPGLNTVIGGDAGENSIGKSTLLMIIDFVFGGKDYPASCADVIRNVGEHIIKWEFEFDGVRYHFSRSTHTPNRVSFCDEFYEEQDELSLTKYCDWLREKYALELPDLTFRGAVSRHVRVKQRGTINPKKPLKVALEETEADAIRSLLKLFEKYGKVSEYEHGLKDAKAEKSAIEGADKFHHLTKAANKTQVKAFEQRIAELEEELETLTSQNENGTLDFKSLQTEQVTRLTSRCSVLKRQRTELEKQLEAIRFDRTSGGGASRSNFEDLRRFFPDANLELIGSIEEFHNNIAGILKDEFKKSEEKLEQMIELLDSEIGDLERQISDVVQAPNLSQSIVIGYSEKHAELTRLRSSIAVYERTEQLKECAKELKAALDVKVVEESEDLQKQLNDKLEELNRIVIDDRITQAPMIEIEGASRYSFYTPNDTGDGTADKSLILFDIACLEETNLPFIAHDSSLFAQIELEAIEHILKLYLRQTSKQVFVTLDKERTYTSKTQEIMDEANVLRLDRGGNELFGWSWNQTDQATQHDEADQ